MRNKTTYNLYIKPLADSDVRPGQPSCSVPCLFILPHVAMHLSQDLYNEVAHDVFARISGGAVSAC